MLLKGALHIHIICSDGALTVQEVAGVYAGLGFDFIALTDHDSLLKKDCYDNQLAGVQTDLILFKGIELTVFERGYVHVNRIDGDSEMLHIFNHPGELNLPLEKVIDRIGSVAKQLPLDAVEVTTKGFYTPEYDIEDIPYPKVATDDSHTRIGCGRAWIEMDCRKTKDSIIRAIRRGKFWNCYSKTY